ncbi:MAG: DUF3192 domain-containing protein [Deltaproteobacteria bacterium]|nr:MAG: DUF3192 domain-containing protein [Deltaproteobacteria bacterium]
MGKIYRVSVSSLTALILMVGCYKMAIYENQKNLMKLEKGMPREAVMNVMGKPDYLDVYQSLYGNTLVILYYYTHRKRFDGKVTKDECTPVVIKNEKLIGWGDDFYQWVQRREKKVNHQ